MRLEGIKSVNASGALLQDFAYTYDGTGNILAITDNVHTASQTFQYDALNRLTRAVGVYGTKTYIYDEIGNILQKDNLTFTYSKVGAGPHAVTSLSDGTTFGYDANGNMVTKSRAGEVLSYGYDKENRLIRVTKNMSLIAEYAYDGDGGRVQKTAYVLTESQSGGGLSYGAMLGQSAGGGSPVVSKYVGELYEDVDNAGRAFIFLGSQRVASVNTNDGAVMFYHGDHLGSTNVLTDSGGASAELLEYDPYGRIQRHEGGGGIGMLATHHFTGKKLDDETGLYYFGARYYDPLIGRFITPDTIVQSPQDPQTLNRYAYCSNNPINRVDPDGHSWKKIKKWAGKIIGTFAAVATLILTGNPALAWQVFTVSDAIISGGIAIASGAKPGRVLASVGMSIGLNLALPGAGESWNRIAQIGFSAARGALVSVATTAAVWGNEDLGIAAAWGAGMAAMGAYVGTMQNESQNVSAQNANQKSQPPDQILQEINNSKADPVTFAKYVGEWTKEMSNTSRLALDFSKLEMPGSFSLDSVSPKGINFLTVAIGVGGVVGGVLVMAASLITGTKATILSAGTGFHPAVYTAGSGVTMGITIFALGWGDIANGLYGGKTQFMTGFKSVLPGPNLGTAINPF